MSESPSTDALVAELDAAFTELMRVDTQRAGDWLGERLRAWRSLRVALILEEIRRDPSIMLSNADLFPELLPKLIRGHRHAPVVHALIQLLAQDNPEASDQQIANWVSQAFGRTIPRSTVSTILNPKGTR